MARGRGFRYKSALFRKDVEGARVKASEKEVDNSDDATGAERPEKESALLDAAK